MRAATSQPGALSLRHVCGLLLLRSCQLFSGQRPRGFGDRRWLRAVCRKPSISMECAGGLNPATSKGQRDLVTDPLGEPGTTAGPWT